MKLRQMNRLLAVAKMSVAFQAAVPVNFKDTIVLPPLHFQHALPPHYSLDVQTYNSKFTTAGGFRSSRGKHRTWTCPLHQSP
jgi:hypothetical protein